MLRISHLALLFVAACLRLGGTAAWAADENAPRFVSKPNESAVLDGEPGQSMRWLHHSPSGAENGIASCGFGAEAHFSEWRAWSQVVQTLRPQLWLVQAYLGTSQRVSPDVTTYIIISGDGAECQPFDISFVAHPDVTEAFPVKFGDLDRSVKFDERFSTLPLPNESKTAVSPALVLCSGPDITLPIQISPYRFSLRDVGTPQKPSFIISDSGIIAGQWTGNRFVCVIHGYRWENWTTKSEYPSID